MNRSLRILPTAALVVALAIVAVAARADTARGTWNIYADHGSTILETRWRSDDGTNSDEDGRSFDPQAAGIASALASAGEHASFALHRDAGDFSFEGWFANGEAAGQYTFTSNESFFDALRKRGYDVQKLSQKLALAQSDVTLAYVDAMATALRNAGIPDFDIYRFGAMKSVGVTPDYIDSLRSAGITDLNQHGIIELCSLKVTPSYIQDIANSGYAHMTAREYAEFKSLGIDGAYVRKLAAHGFKNLPPRKVAEFKSLGIL